MRKAFSVAAVAVLAVLLLPSAAVAGASGSVTGGGAGYFPPDAPHFAGDRVEIALTARRLPAGDPQGRFTIQHQQAGGGMFAHLSGTVDCVSFGAASAVATGVITAGFDDLGIDPVGHRVSIEIVDGAPDVFKLDVSFFSGHTIEPCVSDPVLALAVVEGGYRVAP